MQPRRRYQVRSYQRQRRPRQDYAHSQPWRLARRSPSKYYPLKDEARRGLIHIITSVIDLPMNGALDIVVSDTSEGQIQSWLINQTFRETRLYGPLHSAELEEQYDVVLIATRADGAARFTAPSQSSPAAGVL